MRFGFLLVSVLKPSHPPCNLWIGTQDNGYVCSGTIHVGSIAEIRVYSHMLGGGRTHARCAKAVGGRADYTVLPQNRNWKPRKWRFPFGFPATHSSKNTHPEGFPKKVPKVPQKGTPKTYPKKVPQKGTPKRYVTPKVAQAIPIYPKTLALQDTPRQATLSSRRPHQRRKGCRNSGPRPSSRRGAVPLFRQPQVGVSLRRLGRPPPKKKPRPVGSL